jgi:hypothetical protein
MCRSLKINHIINWMIKQQVHQICKMNIACYFQMSLFFLKKKIQVHDGQMEEEHVGETSAIKEEAETSSGGEIENDSSEEATQEATLRRSTRQIQPPIKLRDYVSHKVNIG